MKNTSVKKTATKKIKLIQRDAQWCVVSPKKEIKAVFDILSYPAMIRMYGRLKKIMKSFADKKTAKFPVGLVNHVYKELIDQGYEVEFLKCDVEKLPVSLFPKLEGITFEPYQRKALKATRLKNRGIVVASTGAGKSVIISGLIKQFKIPVTLIIVPVKAVFNQFVDDIKKFFPDVNVGVIGNGQNTVGQITVGLFQSLNKLDLRNYNKHIEAIIVDECFDAKTEILTEKGFLRFDLLSDEKVAQYDQNTRYIDFVKPLKKIKKHNIGKMIKVKSRNNFDLMTTKKHEILISNSDGTWSKKPMEDIKKTHYYNKFPVAGYGSGKQTELDHFEKLVICHQADGSIHRKNKDGTSILAFSFSKKRKIKEFIKLMEEGKFSYNELKRSKKYGNKCSQRRFMVYTDFVLSKDITEYFSIKDISFIKAKKIIDYMSKWDGYIFGKENCLYTNTDKKAADFYQSVAVLAGYNTKLSTVKDNRKESFNDVYRLYITKRGGYVHGSAQWKPEEVEYKGFVYCVSVPKGNIIVRRNGKVIVTGNCHTVNNSINNILKQLNNGFYRYGFTATPPRKDEEIEKWLNVTGAIGPVICEITDEECHARVTDVEVHTLVNMVTNPTGKKYQECYRNSILLSKTRCEKIIDQANKFFLSKNKTCLILLDEVKQANLLQKTAKEMGIKLAVVCGQNENERNEQLKALLESGKEKFICATKCWNLGFSVYNIHGIVLASARKSYSSVIQGIGRGRRRKEGKDKVVVIDVMDIVIGKKRFHKYFKQYGETRIGWYKEKGWWKGYIK